MKKWHVVLFMFMLIVSPLSTAAASTAEDNTNSQYEIYPLPQSEKDLETDFTITNEVNLVVEDEIDQPTKDLLQEILASKSITVTSSDQVVSDQTNILLGIRGSNGYVDNYFSESIDYDATIFDQIDPYVVTIDKELEENGTIAILGKDTDSAYYGLETLKMIVDQISGKQIHSMQYEDYADSKWRGFIEGFYGFPWSHDSRKSLMEFGGQIKMNAYIYGPKDEKYHNSQWRKPYPEDELAKIQELAEVGHETKTEFIWAIHPGFNMIDWDNYDEEMDTLLAKLDQVYGAGVRQFGLFMDDISTAQSLKDTDKHVKLVNDIADWVQEKGDVKPLVYTPPFYNQAWTGEKGKPYLEALRDLPENVEIMWTGDEVIGTVNQEDMQWVKDIIDRDPFVWLNWPVNGYAPSRLLLGEGEYFLKKGTHNTSGVVSNPLEQAELSKVALFAVADFTWNVDDYNSKQSWKDSFNYIAPEASSEFRTIAHHLSDPSPNRRGVVLKESENIKDDLNQFTDRLNNGKSVDEISERLINEFDHILDAISGFKEKSTNKQMLNEIEPWINSLEQVVKSDKYAVQSVIALQQEDMNKAWEELGRAANAMDASEKFTVEKLSGDDVAAEAGMKRLVPFADTLIKQLDADIHLSIDPKATANIPVTSYDGLDLAEMVDEDSDSYAYVKVKQENGDWYGIDLGKTVPIKDIHILQGRNNEDYDFFQRGILEYSTDGTNWTAIGEERSGYKVDVDNLEIEAQYVRYRLTHAGVPGGKPDLWTAIRDFSVNSNQDTKPIYTNVQSLKDTQVQTAERTVKIENESAITLEPSNYIGIALQSIEQIQAINLKSTNNDLTLEASENGVEWQKVAGDDDSYPNAAYVRLINKTTNAITFDLTKLEVQLIKFTEPVVSHNYSGVYEGEIASVYDNDLSTKVWFSDSQDSGSYVQVDMGGMVDINNVAVAIDDGEGDYFRQGDLQISKDGDSWTTIHSFENPGDRSLNFPDHEAPYRFKRVQTDGEKARYIRLVSTEDNSKWMALNEIIVNEGMEKPGVKNHFVNADPKGANGNEAAQVIDGKLATFYTPEGDAQAGQLNYKLSQDTEIGKVMILQSLQTISDAEVSVRDVDGWHKAGNLTKSLTELDTSEYAHVLEVKVEWTGDVNPQIHEIIPVANEKQPAVKTVADVKAMVQQFADDGEITGDSTARRLQLHLTAVERYEAQEDAEKVVKHTEGFQQMAAYYQKQGKVSDAAYEALNEAADALVVQWQVK